MATSVIVTKAQHKPIKTLNCDTIQSARSPNLNCHTLDENDNEALNQPTENDAG
jgi:hypothetical protein